MINIERIEFHLLHALTEYDKKQSKKKSYNRNALSIYMGALTDWRNDEETAANPLGTLKKYFLTEPHSGDYYILDLNKAVKIIKLEMAAK